MSGELIMYDSIRVGDLPPGAAAYLGYTSGRWPTFAALARAFPRAHLLSMAVTAADHTAEGCDCESGDLTPAQVPGWVAAALERGVQRPVVYASASRMPGVLAGLQAAGIGRARVRLLSAHYGAGAHICGPGTCAVRDVAGRTVAACDGTQWRDNAPGQHGALVDESLLAAGFFPAPPPPAPARKGPRMIMIQPAMAQVPKGQEWPGVFLLREDGALVHVDGSGGGISNEAAFQGVGVQGPAVVTWAQWEALVAAAPAAALAEAVYFAPGGIIAGPDAS